MTPESKRTGKIYECEMSIYQCRKHLERRYQDHDSGYPAGTVLSVQSVVSVKSVNGNRTNCRMLILPPEYLSEKIFFTVAMGKIREYIYVGSANNTDFIMEVDYERMVL